MYVAHNKIENIHHMLWTIYIGSVNNIMVMLILDNGDMVGENTQVW